ncbi:D-alanyl-D-alanine carboxypeptidase [Anoxybacter fermentans]|uniref:serine-type D-Ala-D-Ala carboxypeptidase n=2 Tax=Anoxybacter fermentans TaxID=1323375 RepID=A0A3S9T2W7_9FIRM|nr:D-alanyl-D-alanine carboxypeptidase [Anoxybacter fermentans]
MAVFCTIFIVIPIFSLPTQAEQPVFTLQSRSAILMEASTGEIIFSKNPDEKLPPASITKIMTLLLIMEALEEGRANLTDIVRASENAMRMGGSQIYLEVGEEMSLEDLIKSIAIASANDSCVAVAEYLYGTEEAFVRKMNEKAKELGLTNTYFYNTNGLPPDDPGVKGNYTSAKDVAIMSRELLKYPRVLEWTSTWIDYVRNGEFVLNNTNKLVRHYQGVDGLKTGYTNEAKYCLSATGERNGLRFIAVVMGAPTSDIRFKEVSTLLSYGFNAFKAYEVVEKDQLVQKVRVSRGKVEEVGVIAGTDFKVPLRKGADEKVTTEIVLRERIIAPIKAGEILGEMVVKKDGTEIGRIPLKAQSDVERGTIFQIIFQMLKNLFLSLVNLFR